jgi:hypothetical protein
MMSQSFGGKIFTVWKYSKHFMSNHVKNDFLGRFLTVFLAVFDRFYFFWREFGFITLADISYTSCGGDIQGT